jgi:hypothetical protein
VTSDASLKKVGVEMESSMHPDSVGHVLGLLHPLVQEQYDVAQKHQLIEGLRELQLQDGADFLSEEYRGILRDSEEIQR